MSYHNAPTMETLKMLSKYLLNKSFIVSTIKCHFLLNTSIFLEALLLALD